MCVCVFVCVHMCVCLCMSACVHACTCMCGCMHAHVCITIFSNWCWSLTITTFNQNVITDDTISLGIYIYTCLRLDVCVSVGDIVMCTNTVTELINQHQDYKFIFLWSKLVFYAQSTSAVISGWYSFENISTCYYVSIIVMLLFIFYFLSLSLK